MLGAKRLIVLPTGYACARETPPQGAIANALHALTLLMSRQVRSELESLDEGIDFHVDPPLCPLKGSPYDFSQTAELIERAAAGTDAWLADGGLERREIPHQMNAHKHEK
jgi:NTE family protein